MTERARKVLQAALELPSEERRDVALKLISAEVASDAHPDEYVIRQGSQVVFHSPDQLEALARYADMLDEPGGNTLRFVPPRGPSRERSRWIP